MALDLGLTRTRPRGRGRQPEQAPGGDRAAAGADSATRGADPATSAVSAAPAGATAAGLRSNVTLIVGLALCLLAAQPLARLMPDSYMTLYVGRWIAAHGIPHTEVLTVAAHGRAWIDQQWLAEWLEYGAARVAGPAGVALFNGLALAAAFGGLTAIMIRRGGSPVIALGASAMAVVIAAPSLFIRSQDLVLVLFVAALALCLRDAERSRPSRALGLLIPLLVVWANLHGSVLLGAALCALYLTARGLLATRRGTRRAAGTYLGLGLLVALTPLATPYGLAIVGYYRALLSNPTIAAAEAEWHAPVVGQLSFVVFIVPVLMTLAALGVAAVSRRRPSLWLLALTAITGLAAADAARNTVWFGLAAALLIAETLRHVVPSRPPSPRAGALTASLGVMLVLGGVLICAGRPAAAYESGVSTPVLHAAAAYAATHPCVRLLGDDASASALLWHDPQLGGRVGFDARLEQYSGAALRRWFTYEDGTGPAWRASTAGYGLLLAAPSESPILAARLAGLSGAHAVARDARGIAVAVAPGAGVGAGGCV